MTNKIYNYLIIVISIAFLSFVKMGSIKSETLLGKEHIKFYGEGYNVLKPVDSMFRLMRKAALQDNINIQIVSSYRSFDQQKSIWSRKYNRYISQGLSPEASIQKIIAYSTIPGTSRHHWGTDIDIIDANVAKPKGDILLEKHFEMQGAYSKLKKWMDVHASDYGFYLVYTNNQDRKGFKYEPWHYSYKPLSQKYLSDYVHLDLLEILKQQNILGSNFFTKDFILSYKKNNIMDINPELLSN